MCGRYTIALGQSGLAEAFPELELPADLPARFNVAPSQPVPVITNQNPHRVEMFRWGLVPSWARDLTIGNQMINARAESLAQKPAFRAAYRRRRCLVLSDGFYEWKKAPGSKEKSPYYFKLASGRAFGFAGLWEVWHSPEGKEVFSCTIITTDSNALVAQVHNRMPAILPPEAYEAWLDPAERDPASLDPWLRPYPAEAMIAYPVSPLVNNPRNESPDCILPQEA